MLLFGHIGITTGVVKACEILGSVNRPPDIYQRDSSSRFNTITHKVRLCPYRLLNGIKGQVGSIDYRLVLLGSLLPDILDKPLWFFTAGDILASGSAYGHTLLFNLVLFICGLILVKRRKSWVLTISLCSFMHLISDQLWDNPVTLWWPLMGPFLRVETSGWMSTMIQALFAKAIVYVSEMIGLAVILLLGYRLLVRKSVINFIRTGSID